MKKRINYPIIFMISFLILLSCNDDSTNEINSDYDEVKTDESDKESDEDFVSDEAPRPFDEFFTGTWAQVVFFDSETSTSGMSVQTETSTFFLLDLVQDGNTVAVLAKICDIVINSQMINIIVPNTFINALPNYELAYQVSQKQDSHKLSQPEFVEIRGAVLEHNKDELPTDKSDQRVIDQDDDGHPGMTLFATGFVQGAMYMVQRTITELEGAHEDNNTIKGSVMWSDEQVVLDAENTLLESERITIPKLESSYFLMKRMEAQATCEDVIHLLTD